MPSPVKSRLFISENRPPTLSRSGWGFCKHLLKQAAKAFDDFAGTKPDKEQLHRILGNSPAKAAKQ